MQCYFLVEDVERVLSIDQQKCFSVVILIDVPHGMNSGLNSSCLTSTKLQCAYGLLDVTTNHCEDFFTYDSPPDYYYYLCVIRTVLWTIHRFTDHSFHSQVIHTILKTIHSVYRSFLPLTGYFYCFTDHP